LRAAILALRKGRSGQMANLACGLLRS